MQEVLDRPVSANELAVVIYRARGLRVAGFSVVAMSTVTLASSDPPLRTPHSEPGGVH